MEAERERRAHPRKLVSTGVSFRDAVADGAPLRGWLHDIGRGGCFIATPSLFTFGEEIELDLRLPDRTLVAGKARVVWVRETNERNLPAGMGVRFESVNEHALAAIDKLGTAARLSRPNTFIGIAPPPAASSPSYSPDVKPGLEAPPENAPQENAPPSSASENAHEHAPKEESPGAPSKPAHASQSRRGKWLVGAAFVVTSGAGVAVLVVAFTHHTTEQASRDAQAPIALAVVDAAPETPDATVAISPSVDASTASELDASAADARADAGKRKPKPKPRRTK